MRPLGSRVRSERLRGEQGAELVEFALTLPLLLLLVLGIIEFGFLFQEYEVVTNASREGARLGAFIPSAGYTVDDVTARINDYLTAGGLELAQGGPGADRRRVADSDRRERQVHGGGHGDCQLSASGAVPGRHHDVFQQPDGDHSAQERGGDALRGWHRGLSLTW